MNKDNISEMQDKATRRRDWVFSMWPYMPYAVLKNNLVWYAEFIWPESYNIYQLSHWFAVNIWEAKDKKDAINKLEYMIFNIEN